MNRYDRKVAYLCRLFLLWRNGTCLAMPKPCMMRMMFSAHTKPGVSSFYCLSVIFDFLCADSSLKVRVNGEENEL
jgi:hypothetical protein